ncbi:MAG TPA: phosphate ABC transporter permease subunit PstC [candidate division Zixibacteria bacterium]|nr:phosphate ABC transporter permease subunit PstC [candidate division Zixibacteria bacterium]
MRLKERIIHALLFAAGSTSVIFVALIFLFLFVEGGGFLATPGVGALFSAKWTPVSFIDESYGIFPLLSGSLLVTVLATVFAVPFGIFGAIYIAEVANKREREILKPFVEILAGIPSVVIGFFGLIVLAPIVKDVFGLYSGLNALTGALLLALMAIPTIISISEDAIRNAPRSYKEASLALGASRLETLFKVTLPASLSGIVAAVALGMGRVIGETMVVLMVTGNAAQVTWNPLESVRTMTATIAAEMGEVPFGSDHYRALFCVGIVLMVFTFGLNMLSRKIYRRYRTEA